MSLSSSLQRHFTTLFAVGLVSGLLLSILYASNQYITGDQTQMLFKGYLGAYSGEWLSYGNAASVVGNVPGYLSALVVGLPLMIWDSPWAPMGLLILLRLASFLIFDHVIKQVFSQPVRLAFLVLYWLNPWFLYDSTIYNPSYLCFAAALHLWSSFEMSKGKSAVFTFIHLWSIAFALQFHYSWPILAVMSLFLFYRGFIKVHWPAWFFSAFTIIACLLPYVLELSNNPQIQGQESDRYIGWGGLHVFPVLKAFLYWLRYGSSLFSNRIITDASFDWLSSLDWLNMVVRYLWQGVLFIAGGITVIISAKLNYKLWPQVKLLAKGGQICNSQQWLLSYAFSAVLGILVSAILSPIVFSYWHLIICAGFALIPLLLKAEQWQQQKPEKLAKWTAIVAAFFIVVNLVAANDSNKYHHQQSYTQQVELYLEEQGLRP